MGKNSNAHKNRPYVDMDIAREREDDARRALLRARREAKLAAGPDAVMDVAGEPGEGKAKRKLKKFGKVIVKKKARINPSAIPIRKSLTVKRKSSGIRKPSALMRKTLKKLAKKQEMDLS